MFKSILLFFVILAVAVAIGVGVFYLFQSSSGQANFRPGGNGFGNAPRNFGGNAPRLGGGDFGGERGGGGFNIFGGLFGMTGNLLVVAFITFVIVSVRNIFSKKPELARSE